LHLRPALPLLLVLIGACTAAPAPHPPAAVASGRYLPGEDPPATAGTPEDGVPVQRFRAGATLPDRWWEAFGCDALNALIAAALAHNPTVAEARARLKEAEADLTAERRGTRYPSADATLGVSRQKFDPAAFGIPNVPPGPPFTLYNAQVSVAYTLDLFGAGRHAIEGSAAERDYRRAEADAALLALAANVATAAIRRADLDAEIEYTQSMLVQEARRAEISATRYRAGGIAQGDLEDANAALERLRASLPPLVAEAARLAHQIAVYTGTAPAAAAVPRIRLEELRLPTDVPLSLPAELVRRRPDVRAAEALWQRSGALLGVATANLLPGITLSGSAGTERTNATELLDSFNVWSLGAKLLQPIFHAGELRARRRAAVADYEASAAAYEATVLGALQQVADGLRALEADAAVLEARAAAARESSASLAIARARFEAGGISEWQLREAERQDLESRLERSRAEAARLGDTVAVFHAVAGPPGG